MKKITMQAGSAAWITSRSASKAPAMMGCDPTTSRSELIRMMATGIGKEFSDWQQKYLLDKGHVSEIGARALAEEVVGEDFVPSSAETDDGYLTAAPDGATFANDIGMEAKLWNEKLADAVRAKELPPEKYWQLEQQIMVYGFDYVLFVVSDGTPDKFVSMEYRAVPGRAERLMAGWQQFDKDLKEYKRKLAAGEIEQPKAAPKAEAIQALPSVFVQATGMVTASNLTEFKEAATSFIAAIKTELVCDQDFADAEATVKFCKEAETNLDATKASVLAQMSTVDEVVRTLDHIKKQLADKRLMLDKLVKTEKESRKAAIVTKASTDLAAHIALLEAETKPIRLGIIGRNFGDAVKGLKSLASMQEKVDTALRDEKFAADQTAKDVRAKLTWCKETSAGFGFLFNDLAQIIGKPMDDFQLVVTSRIDAHKAAEAARQEAEREAMRIEEEAKAKAKIEAEAAAARAKSEEEAKAQADAQAKQVAEQQPAVDSAASIAVTQPVKDGVRPATVWTFPMKDAVTTEKKAVSNYEQPKDVRPAREQIIAAVATAFDTTDSVAQLWLSEEFAGVAA